MISSAPGITARRRRKKAPSARGKENVQSRFENFEDIDLNLKKSTFSDEVSEFETASQSSAAASFWKKQSTDYVARILESSRALSAGIGILQLKESETSLLNACRTCVKAATEKKTWSTSLYNNLFVAAHGLRALHLVVDTPETCIKLAYHSIVTLSDRLMAAPTELTDVTKASYLALALYEILGCLFRGFRIDHTKFVASTGLMRFPVPKQSSKPTSSSTLPLRQATKIGAQTTLAVCQILFQFSKNGEARAKSSFGKSVSSLLENIHSLRGILRDTIQQVSTPWNRMCARNKDCDTEVKTFVKAAYRLLWEAAESTTTDRALDWRGDAIFALVMATDDDFVPDEIWKSLPATLATCKELAAVNASKAAAAHVKEHKLTTPVQDETSDLFRFHETMGRALERLKLSTSMISYAEYLGYRTLHLGIREGSDCNLMCVFQGFPCFKHKCVSAEQATVGEATLGLVQFVVSLSKEIDDMENGNLRFEVLQNYENSQHLHVVCRSVLNSMELALQQHPGDLQRCYKLLQRTSLLQRLTRIRKVMEETEKIMISSTCLDVVGVVSCAVSEGLVAVQKRLLVADEDAELRTSHLDGIVDSQSRVISLFDTLQLKTCDDAKLSSDFLKKCDAEIIAGHGMLFIATGIPSLPSVERFAKLLFSIGKRRNEVSTENYSDTAVIPLVLSVHIWTTLESKSTEPGFIGSSQLVERYSYLASLLASVGLGKAALLATVASIAYEASGAARVLDVDPLGALLSFLVDLSSGIKSTTRKSTISLIRRLIVLLETGETVDLTSLSARPSLTAMAVAMKNLVLEGHTDLDDAVQTSSSSDAFVGVEPLLVGAFSDVRSRFSQNNRAAVLEQQGRAAALLLVALGDAMKRMNGESDEELRSTLTSELKSSTRLLYKMLKQAAEYDSVDVPSSLLQGFAHVIAVLSLEKEDFTDKAVMRLYCQQLDRAAAAFDKCHPITLKSGRLNLVASSMYVEVSRKLDQLSSGSEDFSLMSRCETITQQWVGSAFNTKDTLLGKASCKLQVSLSMISATLVCNGDHLKAARVAHWQVLLARRWGPTHKSDCLFSSGVINSLMRADLRSVGQRLVGTVYSRQAPSSRHEELFNLEYIINAIRLQAEMKPPGQLLDCMSDLYKVQTSVSAVSTSDSFHDELAVLWVTSSAHLALSAAYLRCQYIDRAVASAKECLTACQDGIRLSRQSRRDAWSAQTHLLSPLALEMLMMERVINCYLHLSWAYDMLGDYKKAEAYLIAAIQKVGLATPETNRIDLPSMRTLSSTLNTPHQYRCFRELLALKTRVHSSCDVNRELSPIVRSMVPLYVSGNGQLELQLEKLQMLATFLDQSRQEEETIDPVLVLGLADSIPAVDANFCNQIVSSFHLEDHAANIFVNTTTRCNLNLVYEVIFGSGEFSSTVDVETVCADAISQATDVVPSLRALACYYLGTIRLDSARRSGALNRLWDKQVVVDMTDLMDAEALLEDGLELADTASTVLRRDLCRSLALVVGPTKVSKRCRLAADTLLHASIGNCATTKVATNVRNAEPNDIPLFAAIGSNRLDEARQQVPTSWRFVAAAFCPTGELLLAGCQKGSREIACIFPEPEFEITSNHIYASMMGPLDVLIRKSEDQLNGMEQEKARADSNEESAKRNWWNTREELDCGLQSLLIKVEENFFQAPAVLAAFGGVTPSRVKAGEKSPRGNLAARFEEAIDAPARVDRSDNLSKLTVSKLKDKLKSLGIAFPSRARKADLIELVLEHEDLNDSSSTDFAESKELNDMVCPAECETGGEECLILILDENLHRFPFEGLPFLEGRTVTRIPSLDFLVASLPKLKVLNVDTRDARYVVDPESNLGKTVERIMPFIDSLNEVNDQSWSGVVGEFPTDEFITDSWSKESGLFFYCGHGGGKGTLSRKKIESFVEQSDSATPIRSAVILMGCSSGKLSSINRKNIRPAEKATIHYEPTGISLSYIRAGAPCVVGNLWDVTDKDIDRYCLSFMRKFLTEPGNSLPKCVAEARSSCKMKHIIGLAPVCYGFPVVAKVV